MIWGTQNSLLSTVIQNYGDVFPSSQRRGIRDLNKISRSLLISERTGWSDRRNHLGRTDHYYGFALSRSRFAPVCAASVASQHLLDGASTPPLRGGEYAFVRFQNSSNRAASCSRRYSSQ